ncbi:cytidine deaminase-like protein [Mucidula mucida]|nr:cytidine deaminase-like protein [Mucidula mucida]
MFIAIIGTRSAGKSTVEDFLVAREGFTPVRLCFDDEYDDVQSRRSSISSDGSGDTTLPNEEDVAYKHLSFLSMDPSPSPTPHTFKSSLNMTMTFRSTLEMLDHVTRNWRSRFVTSDLCTRELVEPFTKRPFFMLLSIDAPLLTRFHRSGSASLEAFVQEDDQLVFGTSNPTINASESLSGMKDLVHMTVNNTFNTIIDFNVHLSHLDLLDAVHLRPDWDTYFMTLASLASQRSNCMKRRVGAILVRDNRIVATGYNGTPRHLLNCNEGGCLHCNKTIVTGDDSDHCICLHAEENALLEAGRERVGGSVLYCNTCPCLKCTVKVIQTGVTAVVYNLSYKVDAASAALFEQAGVDLRRHPPSTTTFNAI